MVKKLKFQSVVSLVIGSQIGSAVFLLPARLAAIGPISLFSWIISGIGAILLALIFAQLSMQVTQNGGPQAYVEKAFGRKAAFFIAWIYWLISWIGSIAILGAALGYLSPIIGISDPLAILLIQIGIIACITLVNIRGVTVAGTLEIFLTIIKCIPLIIIPIVALFTLNTKHFQPLNLGSSSTLSALNTSTLMTFWGFIGLETATTTSGVIENPKKTVPRAVIMGTFLVAIFYFFNSLGIMGVVPPETLCSAQAPYVEAAEALFKGKWNITIALMAFIACVGTLNAWVLTSGQIAVEAAKNGLFPSIFSRVNTAGVPYMSLLISFFCILPILCFTVTPNILTGLSIIIDVSVIIFIFIYLICVLAYMKIHLKDAKKSYIYWAIAFFSTGFCLWILFFISAQNLLFCSFFIISGVPIYLLRRKKI